MTIGERIKARRIELGLSAEEVAKKIGKDRSTVYRYESNDIVKLPTTVLEPLARALNTTPASLMGYVDEEKHISPISQTSAGPAPSAAEDLPPLAPRDERQIARDLEKMLADLDDKNDLAAVGGTVEDAEDRELLRASLLTSMRLAKQIAKKKFTPKKYRKDENK